MSQHRDSDTQRIPLQHQSITWLQGVVALGGLATICVNLIITPINRAMQDLHDVRAQVTVVQQVQQAESEDRAAIAEFRQIQQQSAEEISQLQAKEAEHDKAISQLTSMLAAMQATLADIRSRLVSVIRGDSSSAAER